MSKSSTNLQLTVCSLDSCHESFADSDALAAKLADPTKSGIGVAASHDSETVYPGSFRNLVCKLSAELGNHSPRPVQCH